MLATKRRLVGRRIVDVKLNRFNAGGGRGWTYDPVLVLDNGALVTFTTDEIESASDYGITPNYTPPDNEPGPRVADESRAGVVDDVNALRRLDNKRGQRNPRSRR